MALNTANQGLPYPEGTDAPNVPQFIQNLATAVEKKLVMVFTNSSQRGTKVAAPTAGMLCVLTDSDVIEMYDGAAWVRVFPAPGPSITRGTTVPSNGSGADGDIFLKI